MNKTEIIESITENYFKLSTDCMTDLAAHSNVLNLEKGTQIVREGAYSDKVFYIASGSARAYYIKDGKDISDWFAFENNFICSINSFFLDIPSPHYIETIESCILLEIQREDVNKLSDQYLDFDRLGKQIVTQTMLQLQQRIVDFQFETALKSYENLLKIRPDITQRIPLTHIASYLGITLETLSRIRNPKYGI